VSYQLPNENYGARWMKILDTNNDTIENFGEFAAGDTVLVPSRSILLFQSQ